MVMMKALPMPMMMKINRAKICDAKIRGFPRPAEGLIPLKLSCLETSLKHFYIYSILNTDPQTSFSIIYQII